MQDKQFARKFPIEYKEKLEAELRKKLMEALRAIEEATRESS